MMIETLKAQLFKQGIVSKEEYNLLVEKYKNAPSGIKKQIKDIVEKVETDVEKLAKADLETISLDDLKTLKINALNQQCNEEILGTFVSLDKVFKFDYEAQNNFVQTVILIQMDDLSEIEWKTEDDVVNTFTVEEFMQIVKDGNTHKVNNISKYRKLKEEVLGAESKEDVMTVLWENQLEII